MKLLEFLVSKIGVSQNYAGDVVEVLLDMSIELHIELGQSLPENRIEGPDLDNFPFRGVGTLESVFLTRSDAYLGLGNGALRGNDLSVHLTRLLHTP